MAHGIVHELEAIKIDEDDGDLLIAAAGIRQCQREAILEERAIGQAGQRIVGGLILSLLLGALAYRYLCLEVG